MKFVLLMFTALAFSLNLFGQKDSVSTKDISWNTWEEATEKTKANPKPIIVFVYADWCYWCKETKKTTLLDDSVIDYMNEHSYPVKLNGEEKRDIKHGEFTLTFKATENGKGYHELAAALLQGKLSYPTWVFLNDKAELLQPIPGYKKAESLLPIMHFMFQKKYETQKWDEFIQEYEASKVESE